MRRRLILSSWGSRRDQKQGGSRILLNRGRVHAFRGDGLEIRGGEGFLLRTLASPKVVEGKEGRGTKRILFVE